MIEMVYEKSMHRDGIVLDYGTFKDYKYYIISMGTHPCAYIELPKNHPYYNVDYHKIPIECHGGLTYSSNYLHMINDNSEGDTFFIGWDYAHWLDYVGYYADFAFEHSYFGRNKKWTTSEIKSECIQVIEQLIELEETKNE